jgi:hypothetical protein
MNESDAQLFAALIDERNEYIERGLTDRLAQVDEQLARLRRSTSAADGARLPGARLVEWRCPKGHLMAAVEESDTGVREFVQFAQAVTRIGPKGKRRPERWQAEERFAVADMEEDFPGRRLICACERPRFFAGPEAALQLREWERWDAPTTRVVIMRARTQG